LYNKENAGYNIHSYTLVRTKWKSDVTKAIVGRTERFQDNTKFSVEIANVDTKFLALVLCGGVLML
jgi:hypothetical protein